MCIRVNISGEMINAISIKYFYFKRQKSPRGGKRTFMQNLGYATEESNWLKYFGLIVTAQQWMPIITERIIRVICNKNSNLLCSANLADSIVAKSSPEYLILKHFYQQQHYLSWQILELMQKVEGLPCGIWSSNAKYIRNNRRKY